MPGLIRVGFLLSLAFLAFGRVLAQSLGTVSAPRNSFDAPQTMCRSLDALGFIAGGWAPAAKDSPVYMCTYPPGPRLEDVSALAELARGNQQKPPKVTFDVTFEVNDLHRTTADTIALTVAATNPAEKAQAKKLLLACIKAVYQSIGRPAPSALPAYLEKEEHYLAHEPYGIVSLFTTSRHDSDQIFWFRLGRNR